MGFDWITPGSPKTITVNGESIIVRNMAFKERKAFNQVILEASADSFFAVIAEQIIAFPSLPADLKDKPVVEVLEYIPTEQLRDLVAALQHGLTDVQRKNSPSSPLSASGDTTRIAETTRTTDENGASTGTTESGSSGPETKESES